MCRHASKNILFSSFPPSFSFCFPYHLLFLAMKMSIPLEMAVGQHLIPKSLITNFFNLKSLLLIIIMVVCLSS